jgi:hypothetical protein
VPEDLFRDERPSDIYYRAAAAFAVGTLRQQEPHSLLTREDTSANLLLRAATNPATLTDTNWASPVAGQAVADVVSRIGRRKSAVSELVNRGLKVPLDGFASVAVPGRSTVATDAGDWVQEGMPYRVRQLDLSSLVLYPYRIGVIIPLTEQLAQYSMRDATTVIQELLDEAFGLAADAKVFGNAAASTGVSCAGLLNGVSAITASTSTGAAAFNADIRALVAALAAAGGGMDPIFIADPGTIAALKGYVGPAWDYTALPSLAPAAKTIIAIEAGSFCSAISAAPSFDFSRHTAMHMESTTPLPLVSAGPTVAAPIRSMFQTATIAMKATLGICFGMRVASGHVQTITNVVW